MLNPWITCQGALPEGVHRRIFRCLTSLIMPLTPRLKQNDVSEMNTLCSSRFICNLNSIVTHGDPDQ